MSYILNALRKSEQERQAAQPDTVTDRILAPQPERRHRTAVWIAVLIASNLVIIAGFLWYAQQTPTAASSPAARKPQAATAAVRPAAKPKPQAETVEPPKPVATPPAALSPSIAELAEANKTPQNQLPAAPAAAKKPAESGQPVPPARAAKAVAAKKPEPAIPATQALKPAYAPEPIEDQEDESDSGPVDAKEPESAPASTKAIPFLRELPYEFRQSVPKMTINVFVYANEPANRFVMINMAKYKAGQVTKDSVEVKEIRSDSLVVQYQNQTFRLERP